MEELEGKGRVPFKTGVAALAVAALCVLVGLQAFVSPLALVAVIVGAAAAVAALARPRAALAALAVYLPFEPFLLKFVPDEMYVFARYLPEGLIYVLAAVALWHAFAGGKNGGKGLRQTALSLPFGLFITALVASALINAVPPDIAVLGARQILRFILVFFIALNLAPSEAYVRRLTGALLGVAAFQAILAIIQRLTGGALDAFLLPSDARALGDITLTAGTSQFWDPGSRAFATMGRYDRLGNFLAFFLVPAAAFLYEFRTKGRYREWTWLLLALGIPALIFTYSRASWFAFLLGFLFVAVWLYRDKRVLAAFATVAVVVFAYVGVSGLNVRFITEAPGQTLVERFYEAFSAARWRGEYYGLGRVYWMVQVPRVVVPASPLFGFGPGQFGGGAAAALGNTVVYERLGLPYGVFGTDGYIDNSWFALWGETGTLGLAFFLWMYVLLFRVGTRAFRRGKTPFVRALGAGYAGAVLGAALISFLSTALEIRAFAFYLWLYGGLLAALVPEEREHV